MNTDQYPRLKLIKIAPQIIGLTHTVQGIREVKRFEEVKTHNRWETVLKEVTYYEFMAVLEKVRAKVVVKEVFGGEGKYFWSVIPYWDINKSNSTRVLHSNNLGEE